MRQLKFFKVVRIRFGKQVSKVRKNWKSKVSNFVSGEKMAKFFIFKNSVLTQEKANFFLVTTKWCAEESSSRWSELQLKNQCLKYEQNLKTNVWRLDLGQINEKSFFKAYSLQRRWFFLLLPKDASGKFIQEGNNHIWSVSLWITKKLKTKVWNLDFVEKKGIFFKCVRELEEVHFF